MKEAIRLEEMNSAFLISNLQKIEMSSSGFHKTKEKGMINQVHLCKALTLGLANIVWVFKELHRPLVFKMLKCSNTSNYTFKAAFFLCLLGFFFFFKQRLWKDSLESYKLLDIIWTINILFNFSLLLHGFFFLRP